MQRVSGRGNRLARRPAHVRVAALDEHLHIETFGGTASYYRFRDALRDHYRTWASAAGAGPDFNPGNCWVTKLAFEPRIAAAYLKDLIDKAGNVTTYLRVKAAAVTVENDCIISVVAVSLVAPRHGASIPGSSLMLPTSAISCHSRAPNIAVALSPLTKRVSRTRNPTRQTLNARRATRTHSRWNNDLGTNIT